MSAATVYKLCERGELKHVRVANAIRVTPEDVEEFIATAQGAPSRRLRKRNQLEAGADGMPLGAAGANTTPSSQDEPLGTTESSSEKPA